MGFLSFNKKNAHNVALIDVSSASVRGAYARIEEGQPPTICYTAHLSIEPQTGTPETATPFVADMLRALEELVGILQKEGAAALRTATGSAHVKQVFVSIGAPWQESNVRVESFEKETPFVFTRALLDEATKRNELPEGMIESGEAVIATILNGYESRQPLGKRVKHADLVILSSMLNEEVMRSVEKTLRHAYHTHEVTIAAFAPVAFEILRDQYPHQKDFLILDVAGTATDVAVVKGGLLVDVKTIGNGVHDLLRAARTSGVTGTGLTGLGDGAGGIIDPARNAQFASKVTEVQALWLENLRAVLSEFSARHPLPRTIFLLADTETRDFLKRLLDTDTLRSLWLSDVPFSIIPVLAEQFAGPVVTKPPAGGDAYIAMLALYYAKRVAHSA